MDSFPTHIFTAHDVSLPTIAALPDGEGGAWRHREGRESLKDIATPTMPTSPA